MQTKGSHIIYTRLMERMSYNVESHRGNDGEISQPTNRILDSGATCHMKLEI